jgi:hypothetical protein
MNKNLLILGAIAVAVLLLGTGFKLPGASAGGFSTLSLTQGTAYFSDDPFFSSPTYTLAVAADGSGGSLRGSFTPLDVAQYTNGNAPAGVFDIEINNNNESCVYTLKNNTIPVYSYGWTNACCNPGNWIYSVCSSAGTYCDGYNHCCTAGISQTKVGDIYLIDSVAHYDTKLQVSLINGADTYSTVLTPTNKNGEVAGIMRAQIVGNLQGDQSCPVPSTDTVLYRPVGTSSLQPKSAYYLSTILQQNTQYPSANPGFASYNSYITQFTGSNPVQSSYCDQVTYSGVETQYRCKPVSAVAIPLIKMYVKASVLGVVVPSGAPKIVSVTVPTADAADTTRYLVTLRNNGGSQDSFDISLTGKRQVNIVASRVSIAAGQEVVVPVYVQGSGIIGNYTFTATSVNNPTAKDTYTVRILINPFCDRVPEAGKIKFNTEYGCYWLCDNKYDVDQREKTCQVFGTFELSKIPYQAEYQGVKYQNIIVDGVLKENQPVNATLTQEFANEYHCTDIGKYATLNGYMGRVITNGAVFAPASKPNQYWLPAPVCNYAAEYGYKIVNGVAVETEGEFNYQAPAQGTNTGGSVVIVTQPPGTTPPTIPLMPKDQGIVLLLVLGAGVVVYKFILKR